MWWWRMVWKGWRNWYFCMVGGFVCWLFLLFYWDWFCFIIVVLFWLKSLDCFLWLVWWFWWFCFLVIFWWHLLFGYYVFWKRSGRLVRWIFCWCLIICCWCGFGCELEVGLFIIGEWYWLFVWWFFLFVVLVWLRLIFWFSCSSCLMGMLRLLRIMSGSSRNGVNWYWWKWCSRLIGNISCYFVMSCLNL